MDILGVIPARGGSKSIPRKNLAPLAGRPLLAYTCDAALASKRLTRVVLSTDDEEIAAAGRACGVEVPFRRPAGLSGDETPMVEVLQDVAARLADRDGYRAEALVVLQPTSPLRRAAHIDEAVELLLETGADSVVSVIEVPHQFSPVSLLRVADGRLAPLVEGPPILRRQDKPRVYARNGPAVIAVRREVVVERGSLYGDDCRPYLMALEDSVDIDTSFDLELAALLLARRGTA
ncbi:MAG: acylneuraminate cytidylyltransferase family protein [Candidatus Rokubacteria bacterium]|nr:acylneuraminate cytidylyltransferase family protein [Candidatus Rokubacteria bacterium]